jgi:hypothetical protein
MAKRTPVTSSTPLVQEPLPAPPVEKPEPWRLIVELRSPTGMVGLPIELPDVPPGEADFYDWIGNEIDKALTKEAVDGFGFRLAEHYKRFSKP